MTTHDFLNRARVLDDAIYQLQTEYINVRAQLVDAISQLQDRSERIVLLEYYCNGKTWSDIAEDLGVTYNTVNRIRKSALQHMEGIIVDDDSGQQDI